MDVLDLFSGIGGFSLGLERAGMRTVAFCEIDPWCRAVLRRHWPDVPVFGDVRTFGNLAFSPIGGIPEIDVICGGFPCQDISVAGKGAGLAGERSGLWKEFARIIGAVRPRYVIVENVAALLGRGLSGVLGDLAALGYDAEWHCIPASAVGAPHRRDRVWVVAYPAGWDSPQRNAATCGRSGTAWGMEPAGLAGKVAYTDSEIMERQCFASRISQERDSVGRAGWWLSEPDVGRVAYGVPCRVDRLRGLGNAVVPHITEIIGRAIMDREVSHGNGVAGSLRVRLP